MRAAGINEIYVQAVKNFYGENVSAIRMGNKVSENFKVTKGLRQGCAMAPTLFKIYINEALTKWKQHCEIMGIPINDKFLYTLLFADDQVVLAMDEQDSNYMIRKLHEQYKRWGLEINYAKTEQMTIGSKGKDMVIGHNRIRDCAQFKYLGVIMTKEGNSNEEIDNKIIQGKKAIGKLNSVLWNDKITLKTKKMIFSTIVESIVTYGSETWEINKRNEKRLKALEMDYWRRACGVSRLEHIRNDEIRTRVQRGKDIMDTINMKRLIWYGHVQRMPDERWPKRMLDWVPNRRRKRGRPRRAWRENIQTEMEWRDLHSGDWENRKLWNAGCGKRRQL